MDFIIRCYSHSPAKSLPAAGLRLATVWESVGNQYAGFSYAKGVADGASASLMAGEVGQPVGSVIYFAMDFDAATSEVSGGTYDYFKGVGHGLSTSNGSGPAFDLGVYGSGAVCTWLKQQGVVSHTWLSESMGWRGSRECAGWNVKQALDTNFIGFDVDPNQARAGFGDFTAG